MSKFLTIFRKPEAAKTGPGGYRLPPPAKPLREPAPLPSLPELPRARLVLRLRCDRLPVGCVGHVNRAHACAAGGAAGSTRCRA